MLSPRRLTRPGATLSGFRRYRAVRQSDVRAVVVSGGRRVIAKESSAYFIRGRVRVTQPDDGWFDVDTYEAGAVHAPATQDSHPVAFVGQTLRLAVIDGVTPTQRTAGFSGVDGAVWAAGVVRTLLAGSGRDVGEVLQDARPCLWSAEVGDSRGRAAGHRIGGRGSSGRGDRLRVRLTRAGDCMAWTKAGESWTPAFSPVAHTRRSGSRSRNGFAATREGRDRNEQFLMEERLAGRPEAWRSSALGHFPVPVLETAELELAGELLIATDGIPGRSTDPARVVADMSFS